MLRAPPSFLACVSLISCVRLPPFLQVLYARKPDQRSSTYQQAIKTGTLLASFLWRASCLQVDVLSCCNAQVERCLRG